MARGPSATYYVEWPASALLPKEPNRPAGNNTCSTLPPHDTPLAPLETRTATAIPSTPVVKDILTAEIPWPVDEALPVDYGSSALGPSKKPGERSPTVAERIRTTGKITSAIESVGEDVSMRRL